MLLWLTEVLTFKRCWASKGVKVNLPPFMNESGQFNESELLKTRRIASLRIHVERAMMERIKNYHILDFVPMHNVVPEWYY